MSTFDCTLEFFFYVLDTADMQTLEIIRQTMEWYENIKSRKMVINGSEIGADMDFTFINPDYNALIHEVDAAITELSDAQE